MEKFAGATNGGVCIGNGRDQNLDTALEKLVKQCSQKHSNRVVWPAWPAVLPTLKQFVRTLPPLTFVTWELPLALTLPTDPKSFSDFFDKYGLRPSPNSLEGRDFSDAQSRLSLEFRFPVVSTEISFFIDFAREIVARPSVDPFFGLKEHHQDNLLCHFSTKLPDLFLAGVLQKNFPTLSETLQESPKNAETLFCFDGLVVEHYVEKGQNTPFYSSRYSILVPGIGRVPADPSKMEEWKRSLSFRQMRPGQKFAEGLRAAGIPVRAGDRALENRFREKVNPKILAKIVHSNLLSER